jgi:phosphate transport system substrate-binding protein
MKRTAIIAAVLVHAATAAADDKLVIPGTGDSQDLLRELATLYQQKNPGKAVEVPDSTGSSGGIESAGTRATPLGRTAVRPSAADHEKHGGLYYRELARVPVVFVVHHDVKLTALTQDQICDIYAGKTTNWEDLGGPNLAIKVQTRPEDGSNMVAIREKIGCFKDLQITPSGEFNKRNGDMITSIGSKPGAIGFMPLSEARKTKYSMLKLGTQDPASPAYSLWISLGFVHKDPLTGPAKDFVDFLATEPAQAVIRKDHIPVTVAESEPPPGGVVVTPPQPDGKTDKADKSPKLRWTGYVQALYSYDPDLVQAGAFVVQRARLKVNVEIIPKTVSFVLMPEFASIPSLTLRDAYASVRKYGQEIRIGQFKPIFGYENPLGARELPLFERSLSSRPIFSTASGTLRDIGVGIIGTIPINEDIKIEDAVALVNGAGENKADDTPRKDVIGRVGVAYRKVLRVGFSGSAVQFEKPDAMAPTLFTRETSVRFGADISVDHKYFFAVVEGGQANFSDPDDRKKRGIYVMGIAKLPHRFQLLSRFEIFEPNTLSEDDTQQRVIFGVNHFVFEDLEALRFSLAYRRDLEPATTNLVALRAQVGF